VLNDGAGPSQGVYPPAFQRPFTADTLDSNTHGNVFAAMAFLQGASLAEIDRSKLDIHDQAYPVIITLRVQKR
jgi:hypothetical protein